MVGWAQSRDGGGWLPLLNVVVPGGNRLPFTWNDYGYGLVHACTKARRGHTRGRTMAYSAKSRQREHSKLGCCPGPQAEPAELVANSRLKASTQGCTRGPVSSARTEIRQGSLSAHLPTPGLADMPNLLPQPVDGGAEEDQVRQPRLPGLAAWALARIGFSRKAQRASVIISDYHFHNLKRSVSPI